MTPISSFFFQLLRKEALDSIYTDMEKTQHTSSKSTARKEKDSNEKYQ